MAKFITEEEAVEIREICCKRYRYGLKAKLARTYGVSIQTINRICTGEWTGGIRNRYIPPKGVQPEQLARWNRRQRGKPVPWLNTSKAHTERANAIATNRRRGTWNNGREVGWYRHTEQWKKNNGERMLKIWADRDYKLRMTHVNGRWVSKLEQSILPLMTNLGFEPQFSLGGHLFDYGSEQEKIVVEVHGCWYHGHSCMRDHGWERNYRKAMLRDRRVICCAVGMGYRVLLLWQCQRTAWRKKILGEVLLGR